MASWHKRARLGIGVFGLVVAGVVYSAIGERAVAPPPAPVQRMDPKALIEAVAPLIDRTTGIEKNFEIAADRWALYEDGSTKGINVRIVVPKEDGRTFTAMAREGRYAEEDGAVELAGEVRIEDSDGFVVTTDAATYDQRAAVAHATGAVSFSKGRMSGSGVGISYDQANDVLTIREQAQVTTTDDADAPVMELAAGSATLDRTQNLLTLDGAVHVLRGDQVIDADRAVARLSEADDIVTFVELRGNARVQGGGSALDAMSARDIDLDYTDDGQRLEAVALTGAAAAAMTMQGGASQQIVAEAIHLTLAPDGASRMRMNGGAAITMAGADGRTGRRIEGEALELDVAADGTLTRAVGDGDVQLALPAADQAPARTIRASGLDGRGAPGQGLTSATFSGGVTFTEGARTARAQMLEAAFTNSAVSGATFTGDVIFEDIGLKACAARLDYQPAKGSLRLSGAPGTEPPIVAEEQIAVQAPAIDVTLDPRRMRAQGGVTTQMMSAAARCRPAKARAAADRGANRLPGLLDAEAAVTINAATLDYDAAAGRAVYSGPGRALLTQGETTAIYGDAITIDQATGDLRATGNAGSLLTLDGATSTGRAHEIRYVDRTRRITYASPPPGFVPPPAGRGGSAVATEPQLSGGEVGDIRAGQIDIVIARDAAKVARIDARTNVRITLGTRRVTGGDTFSYDPAEEKYVVASTGATPVTLINRQGTSCSESSGRSLTFYKANDTILVDGNNRRRTQTTNTACQPAPR